MPASATGGRMEPRDCRLYLRNSFAKDPNGFCWASERPIFCTRRRANPLKSATGASRCRRAEDEQRI